MNGRHHRARAASARRPIPITLAGRASGASPRRADGNEGRGQRWGALAGSRAIFRKEALDFRARGRDAPGGVVRLGAPWIRRSYRLTLALIAAGVVAAVVTPAGESSYGPAVINSGARRFAMLLPAGTVAELPTAKGLSFALPGEGWRRVYATGLHLSLAERKAVSRAGLPMPTGASVLMTGRLLSVVPSRARGVLHTEGVVILPAQPVADVLGREMKAMFGETGTGS